MEEGEILETSERSQTVRLDDRRDERKSKWSMLMGDVYKRMDSGKDGVDESGLAESSSRKDKEDGGRKDSPGRMSDEKRSSFKKHDSKISHNTQSPYGHDERISSALDDNHDYEYGYDELDHENLYSHSPARLESDFIDTGKSISRSKRRRYSMDNEYSNSYDPLRPRTWDIDSNTSAFSKRPDFRLTHLRDDGIESAGLPYDNDDNDDDDDDGDANLKRAEIEREPVGPDSDVSRHLTAQEDYQIVKALPRHGSLSAFGKPARVIRDADEGDVPLRLSTSYGNGTDRKGEEERYITEASRRKGYSSKRDGREKSRSPRRGKTRDRESKKERLKRRKKRGKSDGRYDSGSQLDDEEGEDRSISGSSSESSSGSSSTSDLDSEPEDEKRRKRRKRKARKREEREDKKRREERKRSKRKKEKALASGRWGIFGIISESDLKSKKEEFRIWLVEERKINPVVITREKSKKEFRKYVEGYNCGTLPHTKYYNMTKYEERMNLIRTGQSLPLERGYDPSVDLRAHSTSIKSNAAPKAVKELSRAEVEELRRIQSERSEISQRRIMGLEIPKNFGVRRE